MVPASIKFTQGATTAPAGEALVGDPGIAVVCSNGTDTADIVDWTYELLSRPGGSVTALGVFSAGASPTGSFTPDMSGGFLVKLTTTNIRGVKSTDQRVFLVLEASGRKIPPFGSNDDSLNFDGTTLGWSEIMEEWFRGIDSLVISGNVQTVKLSGTGTGPAGAFAIGDWVCGANDPSDNTVSKLATSANLAVVGGLVRGVLVQTGVAGQTKAIAISPDRIAEAVCSLGAGVKSPLVLNPVTGRAIRKATPAPTDILLGTIDPQGNVDMDIVHPGVGTWIDNLSFVSVLDYGADPTGVADCATAHDAAHAIALATGKKLYYGAGTYKLGSSKTVTVPMEIIGILDGLSNIALSKVWQVDATPITYVDETTDANSGGVGDFTPFPTSETVGDYCLFGYTTPFGRLIFDNLGGTAGVGGLVTWEYWTGTKWMLLDQVVDGTTSFTATAGNGKNVSWHIPPSWAAVVINGSASLFWVRVRVLATYTTNPALNQAFIGNAATVTISSVLEARPKKIFGDNANIAFSQTAQPGELLPEWFGAVGNSTTDDTVALQKHLYSLRGAMSARYRNQYKVTAPLKLWGGLGAMANKAWDNALNFDGGASFGSVATRPGFLCAFSDFAGTCEIDYVGNGSGTSTFVADPTLDEITIATPAANIDEFTKVQFTTTTTLPAGLSLGTDYWLIFVTDSVMRVATSLANAIAGTAVNITDTGVGVHTLTVQASGDQMMRLKNPTGITANTDCIGLPAVVYNCTTNGNNITCTNVCKVRRFGADTYVWLYNNQAGATAPDFGLGGGAGTGTIRFEFGRAMLDVRAREVHINNITCAIQTNSNISCYIRTTEAPEPETVGATAATVTHVEYTDITCIVAVGAATCRSALRWADSIIPAKNSSLTRFLVNGDGVPMVWHPFQVDYNLLNGGSFLGIASAKMSAVIGIGRAGQSERNVFKGTEFNLLIHGFFVPRTSTGGGNLCQADFYDCELGHFNDAFVDMSANAFDVTISRCKGEVGGSKLINDRGGASNRLVRVEGCELQLYPTNGGYPNKSHPSQRLIETNSAGVPLIIGNVFSLGDNFSKYKVLQTNHNAGASNQYPFVVMFGNRVAGSSDVLGVAGFVDARRRGPQVFAGTETLDVKINGVATVITVTFSQANFNTANGYTVSLSKIRMFEIARLVEYFCRITAVTSVDHTVDQITIPGAFSAPYAWVRFTTTGTLPAGLTVGTNYYLIEDSVGVCRLATSRANAVLGTAIDLTDNGSGTHTMTLQSTPNIAGWGSEDDEVLRFFSDDRAGASVQITGGTANVMLDFNTATVGSRSAIQQVTIDSASMIEPSTLSSSDEMSVFFFMNHVAGPSTEYVAVDHFFKTYNGTATLFPDFLLGSIGGLARQGAAKLPKNFWNEVTVTGTTGTSTFTANAGTDEITYTAGIWNKLTKVQFTTTVLLPAGLNLTTDYWLIKVSTTVSKVASSLANAIAGTFIDITDAGTGVHTMTVQAGGATFVWTFGRTEDDSSYANPHATAVTATDGYAAGSDVAFVINKTTTECVFKTTDPGNGKTVVHHVEMRR